jgi:hypothetical protein
VKIEKDDDKNDTDPDMNEDTKDHVKYAIPSEKVASEEVLQSRKIKSKWANARRTPNSSQEKKMIALALKIAVTEVLENHCYEEGGEVYHQLQNGIIGLDLMRSVARVYMVMWSKKFKKLCKKITDESKNEEINIVPKLFNIYVDDIQSIYQGLPEGAQLNEELMIIEVNPDKIDEDKNKASDVRMFQIINNIANTIDKDIQLSQDVPSIHPELGERVPYLDMAFKIEKDGTLTWKHFEKPSNSQFTLQNGSAFDARAMRTVHTQEVNRIMRNNHEDIPETEKADTISGFMKKLKNSGFPAKYRREVLTSAKNAFAKQKEASEEGRVPLNRPKTWHEKERAQNKKNKSKKWYKGNGDYTNFIMIPATPGSVLKKQIEKEIEPIFKHFKIRVVERPGQKIIEVLQQKIGKAMNEKNCKNLSECLICNNELGGGDCRKNGIVYQILCKECSDQYIGETAANGFTRGGEHLKDYENKNDNSVLQRHVNEKHEGSDDIEFRMKIMKTFKNDPLGRQCTESVLISEINPDKKINNKEEWNLPGNIGPEYVKDGKIVPKKVRTQSKATKEVNNKKINGTNSQVNKYKHKLKKKTMEDPDNEEVIQGNSQPKKQVKDLKADAEAVSGDAVQTREVLNKIKIEGMEVKKEKKKPRESKEENKDPKKQIIVEEKKFSDIIDKNRMVTDIRYRQTCPAQDEVKNQDLLDQESNSNVNKIPKNKDSVKDLVNNALVNGSNTNDNDTKNNANAKQCPELHIPKDTLANSSSSTDSLEINVKTEKEDIKDHSSDLAFPIKNTWDFLKASQKESLARIKQKKQSQLGKGTRKKKLKFLPIPSNQKLLGHYGYKKKHNGEPSQDQDSIKVDSTSCSGAVDKGHSSETYMSCA